MGQPVVSFLYLAFIRVAQLVRLYCRVSSSMKNSTQRRRSAATFSPSPRHRQTSAVA
jgi:hypothetical protein